MPNQEIYTFSKMSNGYIEYCQYERSESVTEQTLKSHRSCLRRINRFIGHKDVRQLSLDDVVEFKKTLIDKGLSKGYLQRNLCLIRCVLYHCQRKGLTVLDPKKIELPNRERRVVDYLNLDEIQKFIRAIELDNICGVRFMAIVAVMLQSAMRVSEVLSLDRDSIQVKSGGQSGYATIIGKGRQERIVYFKEWSLEWIDKYLKMRDDDNPALFVTHSDFPYTRNRLKPDDVRRYFKITCKRAGIKRTTPHTLRRTAATTMRINGANIFDIQHVLGHSKLTVTEAYLGVDYPHLEQAHNRFMDYSGIEDLHAHKRLIAKPWAYQEGYLKCKRCGTKDRRHAGHGYCDLCYIKLKRAGRFKNKFDKAWVVV